MTKARVQAAFGNLPLYFVENQGQVDSRVAYYVQGRDTTVYFTSEGLTVALTGPASPPAPTGADEPQAFARPVALRTGAESDGARQRWAVKLDFVGANPEARPQGQDATPAVFSYFKGPREQWKTGLGTYASLVYQDLWPGIDLVYTGTATRLKYTFLIQPGADPEKIKLAYRGATAVTLTGAGELDVSTPVGGFRDAKPYVYQDLDGQRVEVPAAYALDHDAGGGTIGYGFRLGRYDRSKPLVLDPAMLVYSTYLGGAASDMGLDIAVDAVGEAYVTGSTFSANFPTTPGAFDTTAGGNEDAFVAKLDAMGSALVYSTYLGGNFLDRALGIAVDGSFSAYVMGFTNSANFPITAGAFDTTLGGGQDAFVTKLNALGNGLVYSTYLGGSSFEFGSQRGSNNSFGGGITVDGLNNAYVTGQTPSTDFPTTPGAFDTSYNGGGCCDAFVTKLNAAGTGLVYSTYLGGNSSEFGEGIALDPSGSAYVTGFTTSTNYPTTVGAFQTTKDVFVDAFVTKLNPSGTGLVYSTYLAGGGEDDGTAIAVDAAGNAFVTGDTSSANFPTTTGAFDTSFNGNFDAFGTMLDLTGSTLVYSTFLGGSGTDLGFGIAVNAAGSAYVTGSTASANFPTTAGSFDTSFGGATDAFLASLDTGGAALAYSTFLGGNSTDIGQGIAVDTGGNAYVTGYTLSSNFPTTSGAYDTTSNGSLDVFVAKISDVGPPATLTLAPSAAANPVGTSHTVTATVRDVFTNPTPGIIVRFSVTGSVIASGSCTTNATGQCSFTYSGPTAPGTDAIHAYADTDTDNTQDAGEPFGDATKTWVPTAPATLTLSPAAATNPVGTSHTVTATVRDAFGNPTPGIIVRFMISVTHTISDVCTTDPDGQCSLTYPGTQAGADTITAYADTDGDNMQDAGEPSGTATKTWTPGAPATLTLDPAADTNTVGESHCVTATVRDQFGNPVPSVTVRFSVTGANSASGFVTTNGSGQATFCYTGTTAGEDAITAYADTNNDQTQNVDEPFGTATKTWTPGAPATLTLEPPTATNPFGTSHTVTATVRDAFTNPTPGIIVRFAVTGSVATSGSCTTNATGQCPFTYTSPQAGTDAITAYADTDGDHTQDVGEPSGTATKVWTPPTQGCPANGGDDDEDDDGLEDEDERLFGTVVGIADSDRDGRKDGNDDADGDGEDDEDEDDDTEDDCPNDSDGDGTDDEDEDDDDDDFDDDGERDDEDSDDDSDGEDDDDDSDDDNDGERDDEDGDDDNDSLEDEFDSESTKESQGSINDVVEAGEDKSYDVWADSKTLLLIATAEAFEHDPLNQWLRVDIYDPNGRLLVSSPATPGRAVSMMIPVLPGKYKVKVVNLKSGPIPYQTLLLTRTHWVVNQRP